LSLLFVFGSTGIWIWDLALARYSAAWATPLALYFPFLFARLSSLPRGMSMTLKNSSSFWKKLIWNSK
jgi:hypothetical protein